MNKIFSLLVVIILTFRYLGDCIFIQFSKNSLKFHIGKDKEIFAKKTKKPKKKLEDRWKIERNRRKSRK